MPIMELIKELHENDMELADYWRERSNFWFDRHREKDMMFWNEREKRMDAEKQLKELEDGRHIKLTGKDNSNGVGKTWKEEGNSGVISETG